MRASYQHMTPFLTGEEADTMLRIAEARGVFGTYADEALNEGLGEQLPQRFDAAFNYINHGIDGQVDDELVDSGTAHQLLQTMPTVLIFSRQYRALSAS